MLKLQVLGSGCPKCEQLSRNVAEAAKELGVEYELEKVKDLKAMMAMGVMMTPALVIDGEVKVVGKVPGVSDIRKMLAERM